MAINIKEILHPSDSDSIKFEKVNYNFDQILINGGGPQGIPGIKGQIGGVGSTGLTGDKGDKGDQGIQGIQGTTNTPWERVAHTAIGTDTSSILKPKVETDSVASSIWLGDSTFDEDNGGSVSPGFLDNGARLVVEPFTGFYDHFISYRNAPADTLNMTINTEDGASFYGYKKDINSTGNIGFKIDVNKVKVIASDYIKLNATGNVEISGGTDILLSSTSGQVKSSAPVVISNYLNVNTTSHVRIAAGTGAQRPATGVVGMVRYNSTDNRYEGHNGTSWIGLGGLIDSDGDTFIIAEATADQDMLRFNVGPGTSTTVTTSVEKMTIGETINDGFLNTASAISFKVDQGNLGDIQINTVDKGLVFQATTVSLAANQVQPHNEGTGKVLRRLDDYFYQEDVTVETGGTCSTTPFNNVTKLGSSWSKTTAIDAAYVMSNKIFRVHKKTSGGFTTSNATYLNLPILPSKSKMSYVKTGHLVHCWGNIRFIAWPVDPGPMVGGINALGQPRTATTTPTPADTIKSKGRVAVFFADQELFHYRNTSTQWIYFPIPQRLFQGLDNLGVGTAASGTDVVDFWGAIPPGGNYFNIAYVNGGWGSEFAGGSNELTGTTDTFKNQIKFLNVSDFQGNSTVGPMIASDLSFNFTMPTDQKSYDVVSTAISTYTETTPAAQDQSGPAGPFTPVGAA